MAGIAILNNPAALNLSAGTVKISGTVTDLNGLPAARTVIAIAEPGGSLIASTVSDAVTGAYEMIMPGGTNEVFTVLAFGAAGENSSCMGGIHGVIQ
ncbi:MAG: hypothetical protein KKA76_18005 [Proteobacteria bacterium]|nr:hypothetical protein [Pseudomonadota bacterium]